MKTRETFVGERMAENTQVSSGPKQAVSFFDALAVTVGIVIGAGIFGTPSLVASFAGSEMQVYAVWIAGGVVSLIGALVYAELTTTYQPDAGLDLWVPSVFSEQYDENSSSSSVGTAYRGTLESILCEAKYSNFRRFQAFGQIKK